MRESQSEAVEEKPQSNTIWQELETWSRAFKPWQKFILGHAVRVGRLDEAQINQAYTLFLQNNDLAEMAEPPVDVLPVTGRPATATQEALQLAWIGELSAINALPTTAQLHFPSQLTIIYGGNGAGKSGFVRVLSKACFSRDQRDILPNIYDESPPPKQSATINILSGGNTLPAIVFDGSTEHSELKRIAVFNTTVARSLLTDQNPLCFKPAGFDVFPEMARVYGELVTRLETDIASRTRDNIFGQTFLDPASPVSEKVKALSADTNIEELRVVAVFGETEIARIVEIQGRIDDLKLKSVADKIKQLEEAKRDIEALEKTLAQCLSPLREAKRVEYREQIANHRAKIKAVAEHGSESFKQTFFSRTGSPEWKSFVEAAHALGKAEHEHYPRKDDHCLLCQRPLDAESQQFIERLWEFLSANAQRDAKDAQARVEGLRKTVQANNLGVFAEDSRVHGHLTRLNPAFAKEIDAILKNAQRDQASILEAMNGGNDLIATDALPNPSQNLLTLTQQIEADLVLLRQSDVDDAIKKLEAERVMLRHRQLLSQIFSDVEKFVTDAAWAKKASISPKRNLNPKHITDKQTSLFTTLIADGYRQRLVDECAALDCALPVEFRTKGYRGETVRLLEMKGHSPEDVLSEGEQRAVALADFLTEVALNPASAGIILDDPVNSQDHERKEKIACRLIQESETRQVIIFTHDLVFLTMLGAAAKDAMVEMTTHWVAKDSATGAPGAVSLNDTPDSTRDYMNTQRAKNTLAEAKKVIGSQQLMLIRRGTEELRRTIEEIVPMLLLKGIVKRWNDRVMVTALARVDWDDAFIKEIVSTYEELCSYITGHTHTEERAGAPPEVKILETFITKVDNIISRAKKDKSAATTKAAG